MRFTQIRDFLAVVDAGSLHAAARRLGISQPAMTKSVRGLEAELSVQLLQRTTRGIVLTPSGRMFLARARVVQSELDKARDELAESERQGSVAIGVGPLAATAVVPEALTLFRKRFPNASVHIMEAVGRVLTDLLRDEVLDLGVARKPDVKLSRALALRPLYHNPWLARAIRCPMQARSRGSQARNGLASPLARPRRRLEISSRSSRRPDCLCRAGWFGATRKIPRSLCSQRPIPWRSCRAGSYRTGWRVTCCGKFRWPSRCLRLRRA